MASRAAFPAAVDSRLPVEIRQIFYARHAKIPRQARRFKTRLSQSANPFTETVPSGAISTMA